MFGTCNRDWDDFVVASRIAHFHSSGNADAANVGNPARAYNVTAVGRYDAATNTMTQESGYLNPSTGVEKPEIVAPGANVELAAGWVRSGSSISAPIAAGFAADMMSVAPFFRNAPQAIRAYLIAGAHNVNGGVGLAGTNGAKDGAGRIDFLDTYYYRSGKIWTGGNDAYFVNNKITETTQLTAGQHYTIAIAWLADGQYAYDQTVAGSGSTLDMRMKLTLSKGLISYVAYQSKNNFQLLDVVAPSSGTWTVTIERTFDANVGPLNLALTVGQHQ